MPYDKQSFLAGVAAGRNMESWPAFESINSNLFQFTVQAGAPFTYIVKFWGIVYWGDGQTTECLSPNTDMYWLSHTYPAEYIGNYVQVTMIGLLYYIDFSSFRGTDYSLISIDTPLPKYPSTDFRGNPITQAQVFVNDMFCRECAMLETIPNNLLKAYADDERITVGTIDHFFSGCSALISAPNGLFKGLRINGKFAHNIFYNCQSLVSIPDDLFDGHDDLEYFAEICKNCTSLREIPSGLFAGHSVATTFYSAFENCESLRSIPGDLLDGCYSAGDFMYMFRRCRGLESIPGNLFRDVPNSRDTWLGETFYYCSNVTSAVPELWITHDQAGQYADCFYRCYRATNYSDIPTYWK